MPDSQLEIAKQIVLVQLERAQSLVSKYQEQLAQLETAENIISHYAHSGGSAIEEPAEQVRLNGHTQSLKEMAMHVVMTSVPENGVSIEQACEGIIRLGYEPVNLKNFPVMVNTTLRRLSGDGLISRMKHGRRVTYHPKFV